MPLVTPAERESAGSHPGHSQAGGPPRPRRREWGQPRWAMRVLGPWIRDGESLTLARLPVVIAWKRALLVGKKGPSWPWWGGHAGEQGVNKGLTRGRDCAVEVEGRRELSLWCEPPATASFKPQRDVNQPPGVLISSRQPSLLTGRSLLGEQRA